MKLFDGRAISQSEAGDSFSRYNALRTEKCCVYLQRGERQRDPCFVINIDGTRIKRNYVTYLINQDFECLFDLQTYRTCARFHT